MTPLPGYDDVRVFTFDHPALTALMMGDPQRIIVHRQGNPGATAENALGWGNRTGAFSIHYYVDGGVVWTAVSPFGLARHVAEARIAEQNGFPTTIAGFEAAVGRRGDIRAIGIETCDSVLAQDLAPGQLVALSQRTRQSLVRLLAELCNTHHLSPLVISEHATWDPWKRPEDVGDTLYIPDLQDDVQDVLDGRDPWRTVGQFARGVPNTNPPPAPAPSARTLEQVLARIENAADAIRAGRVALETALQELQRARDEVSR